MAQPHDRSISLVVNPSGDLYLRNSRCKLSVHVAAAVHVRRADGRFLFEKSGVTSFSTGVVPRDASGNRSLGADALRGVCGADTQLGVDRGDLRGAVVWPTPSSDRTGYRPL